MVETATEILTAEQICEILRIQPNTLYTKKWRRLSGIPTFRQGKYLFAFKGEFWAWYQARAVVCV
jgi:hypothetical protein